MATDTPTWEHIKENAAPLQRGRNVATLEQACVETQEDREAKESSLRTFENLVAPSEEMATNGEQLGEKDDPLIHWMSYIKFHQDYFPSDKQSQFLLMERCTRALVHQRKYANDIRFIRICAMYADQTGDPGEIFKYLHSLKVGTLTSIFWIAWAFWEEKQENFKKVEKIFQKGLRKKAKPLHLLEQRHKQFERRFARHLMNAEENGMADGEDDEEGHGNRGILGHLSEEAFRRNDRSSSRNQQSRSRHNQNQMGRPPSNMSTFIDRSAPSHQSRRQFPRSMQGRGGQKPNSNSAATTGFQIFQDGNENDGNNLDQPTYASSHRKLAREKDRRKENTLEAEKWNQRGGLHATSNYPSSQHAPRPQVRKPQPFAVFVDEECAAEHQRQELHQQADDDRRRRHRDERTFRPLEAGDSVAEQLYQDPLRYLKDPSQRPSAEKRSTASVVPSDQGHSTKRAANTQRGGEAKKSNLMQQLACDHSLLKDSNGQEQCFNEQRAMRGHFKLVSSTTDFNTLRDPIIGESARAKDDSRMSIDDNNTTTGDVSMEEASIHNAPSEARRAESQQSETSRRVLFHQSASFEMRDRSINVSQCSSTVNEANAVGVHEPQEETINTKLAMRDLSLMFCSPAVGLTTSCRKVKRSKTEPDAFLNGLGQTSFESNHGDANSEESETADFAAVMDLVGSCNLNANNSILQPGTTEEENQGPKNPHSRATSPQAVIDEHALKPLHDDPAHPTSCHTGPRRALGPIAQDNPLARAPLNPLHDDAGFAIYDESSNDAKPTAQRQHARKPQPFGVHEDDEKALYDTFTILEEEELSEERNQLPPMLSGAGSRKEEKSAAISNSPMGAFDIFQDTNPSPVTKTCFSRPSQGKQARPPPPSMKIFEDTPQQASPPAERREVAKKPSSAGFSIHVDSESPQSSKGASVDGDRDDGGDTATFSIFNNLMETVGVDEGSSDGKGTTITDTSFGDLSAIDPNMSLAPARNLESSPTITLNFRAIHAFDYNKTNKDSLKSAMKRLKDAAAKVGQNASLITILASKSIYDVSNYVLPRIFKRKLLDKGSEIKIGSIGGTVKRELGRGAYGVVVLLDLDDEGSSSMAVKAQSWACGESLAHEYDILRKIEDRIGPQYSRKQLQSQPFPYPKPMSFVSLADGGLMSMTAGSESGLNLVDLVNAYQEKNRRLEDVVALHYVSRMLHHLEALHWHGKILHCDVKPDNWVLCTSKHEGETVKGSELMLVDYGRAVDLSKLAGDLDAMDVKLTGETAEEDMMCVAMRKQRPWSFDADTFGLCASAHVLLYGTHIEIIQNRNKRWMPRQSLKRYWQRDLWTELFDTLLNSDEGTTIGSRPKTLGLLRKEIEIRFEKEPSLKDKLDYELNKQEQILWSTRPQLQPKRKR